MKKNFIKKEKNRILENIQEAIVIAGGRFFRKQEIKRMNVDELLNTLIPNNIVFDVEYKVLKDE